ncbi:hypothetical protein HNR74_004341 [Flammeovirga kamogawensis]|nr:hypothetical protein [Flammeovirga kamogawensis]
MKNNSQILAGIIATLAFGIPTLYALAVCIAQ